MNDHDWGDVTWDGSNNSIDEVIKRLQEIREKYVAKRYPIDKIEVFPTNDGYISTIYWYWGHEQK